MKPENHKECPIAKIAQLLSDRWTILIIRDALKQKMRFTDLEHSLVGISSRTLTAKIKRLEEENILIKDGSYYVISKNGKKLEGVLEAMSACGRKLA